MVALTDNHTAEPVDEVAASVLATLYTRVAGEPPLALRAYAEGGTLLLLLRFDAALLEDPSGPHFESLLDRSLMAMPDGPRPTGYATASPKRPAPRTAGSSPWTYASWGSSTSSARLTAPAALI